MKKIWLQLIDKLQQLKGTPESIALGAAFGISISFTPFIGFHSVLACIFSWLFGGNILAALAGTLIGNPWTFPIIWISVYYVGMFMLNGTIIANVDTDFYEIFKNSTHALLSFDFSQFDTDVWPIFYPMLLGCIPFCIAGWIFSYYTIKHTLQTLITNKDKIK